MKDLMDLHTHTTASGHAYGTLSENISVAKAKGLALVGISDHAPSMPGSAPDFHFANFRVIPREVDGIKVVMGVELNVIDYAGSTDLSENFLRRTDYAIASLHDICLESGTVAQNTSAIIGTMKNPHVLIIGHPDNPYYPVDFEKIARAAAENHVLLEINNSSYQSGGYRAGSRDKAKIMLAECKKYGTGVIMSSDAHISTDVGNHELSQEVLKENNFPPELVVNYDVEKFFEYLKFRKNSLPF